MMLMKHMFSCMLPKSIIIAYNTDSFTIRHPRPNSIEDARDITKHKDDFENMGKLKIEKGIKIKGSGFSCKMKQELFYLSNMTYIILCNYLLIEHFSNYSVSIQIMIKE